MPRKIPMPDKATRKVWNEFMYAMTLITSYQPVIMSLEKQCLFTWRRGMPGREGSEREDIVLRKHHC